MFNLIPLAYRVYAAWALYAVCAVVVVGLYAWRVHVEREVGRAEVQAKWDADNVKRQAAFDAKLASETAKTKATEGKLNAALAALESRDAENAKTIAELRADLRRNSRAAGGPGLRDPFAGSRLGSGGAASTTVAGAISGATDAGSGTGVLSSELESFLLDQAAIADDINRAYIACRADALSIRALSATP